MENKLLNKELMRQLSLIKFDRNKILSEQDSKLDKYVDRVSGTDKILKAAENSTKSCNTRDGFADTYPNCCKYPQIAKYPDSSVVGSGAQNDFFYFDESIKRGYCFYDTGRRSESGGNAGIQIPMDASLILSDTSVQSEMVSAIFEKFKENNYALAEYNMLKIKQFNKQNGLNANDTEEYEDAIYDYLTNMIVAAFPIGSIVAIILGGNVYSPKLLQKEDWTVGFSWWSDQSGANYKQPSWTDRRSKYEKFVDDWGAAIQIAVGIATSVAVAILGSPMWAIIAEIAIDVAVSIPVIINDYNKGNNISAFFGVLFMGLPFLKLNGAFRGVSEEAMKKAYLAIQKSGLSEASTQEDVVMFLAKLSLEDPDTAKVIKQALTLDDITKNILINRGGELVDFLIKNQLKQAFNELGVDFIKTPFWRSYVARELKTAGALIIGNAVADIILGRFLNDEEKLKISTAQDIIPTEHQTEYLTNFITNIDLAEKQMPELFRKDIEQAKQAGKIPNKALAKLVREHQEQALADAKRKYVSVPAEDESIPPKRNDDWYKSNGWVKFEEIPEGATVKECELSDDTYTTWIKI
jgi:hypothetical protein